MGPSHISYQNDIDKMKPITKWSNYTFIEMEQHIGVSQQLLYTMHSDNTEIWLILRIKHFLKEKYYNEIS